MASDHTCERRLTSFSLAIEKQTVDQIFASSFISQSFFSRHRPFLLLFDLYALASNILSLSHHISVFNLPTFTTLMYLFRDQDPVIHSFF